MGNLSPGGAATLLRLTDVGRERGREGKERETEVRHSVRVASDSSGPQKRSGQPGFS